MEFWIVLSALGLLLSVCIHELILNERKINARTKKKDNG